MLSPLLPHLIPTEIWAEAALQLLDARDLLALTDGLKKNEEEEEESLSLLLHSLSTVGIVFDAKRVLLDVELAWFKEWGVSVTLLHGHHIISNHEETKALYHLLSSLPVIAQSLPFHLWTRNGKLHRDNDLPAAVFHAQQCRIWLKNGEVHRDGDLPAVDLPDVKVWFRHGKRHRDNDMPARVDQNGDLEWWFEGALCRNNGQPTVEWHDGDKWWNGPHGPAKCWCSVWGCFLNCFPLHREGDLPAIESADGSRSWYLHGKLARPVGSNQPAIVRADGTREWYLHAQLHRDGDLPAIERGDGTTREWWLHNMRHRASGLPAIERGDGTREWFLCGRRHRADGLPAIESSAARDGWREWFENGERHRDNGLPAVVGMDGTREWFVRGKRHRNGGRPAVDRRSDGTREWWYHGIQLLRVTTAAAAQH